MESSRQLIDSLTAHISLYNSSSKSPISCSNLNPRSSILKWFKSLTPYQRQSHLTIVAHNFTQLLLQMKTKIQSNGHGLFIILPDIPSGDLSSLPSLCYRRSHGLLLRASELERGIAEALLLFNSKEGENLGSGCGIECDCLDSVTVSQRFVENVDCFVEAMDGVSGGGFLRGEESGLGSDWVELDWLKGKGYYSLEAFVANRLEVALRLAWLNCNNGKKRGVKLKEKMVAAGLAANVYWRKKGCMDWWEKLEGAMRRRVLQTFLGKAAKSLTADIMKRRKGGLEDEFGILKEDANQSWRSNHNLGHRRSIAELRETTKELSSTMKPASANEDLRLFVQKFNSLIVLREISTMLLSCQNSDLANENLFFGSLVSFSTISDCISRKLQSFLMVVSLDCTKLELLDEGSSSNFPKKAPEKLTSGNRKKKKSHNRKRLLPVPRSVDDDSSCDKPAKDVECESTYFSNKDMIHSNKLANMCQDKDLGKENAASRVGMECNEGEINRTVKSTSKKNKKARKKHKSSGLGDPVKVGVSQVENSKVSAPDDVLRENVAVCQNGVAPEIPNIPILANDAIFENGKPSMNSTCSITSESIENDIMTSKVEGNHVAALKEGVSQAGLNQPSEDEGRKVKTVNHSSLSNIVPSPMPVAGVENVLEKEVNSRDDSQASVKAAKSSFSGEGAKGAVRKEEIFLIRKQDFVGIHGAGIMNSSGYPSFEWPNTAPAHFPYANSHLPAATDRLHLDAGHNWHNHFHHRSFMQTVHQVRTPPIENGCNEILPRPMPMSLDWPPMVRSVSGLIPYSYRSGCISRRQSFQQGFNSMHHSSMTTDDERIYSNDPMDSSEFMNSQEPSDEYDGHWIGDEDYEVHAVSGMDYSQYFGGGVMYWDSLDHPGTTFSRPPSLSSDDSSWACREADMNRNVDDMVAFSSSYSTNGLTSPSAASFCSPFDPHGPAHQTLGYVLPGGEVAGKVLHSSSTMSDAAEENIVGSLSTFSGDIETKTGDLLPYPILPPIIIPSMSRERSRSEFKRSHDHKSPCVPPNRREQPSIKRPPSPVVLCVPHAPRPPPPSPVSDSRKHRGFPTVRSGSSSPRHWGVRGWFHDGINFEQSCVRVEGSEVVWPSSWRKKSLSARQLTQPLPGALLQDRLIAISLARDQEHPDVAIPLQPPEPTHKASLPLMHSLLHDEIDSFCKQVATENMVRKPYINWAVKRVTRSLQVLWPRSRTNIFGSNATGLSLPTSDVDLVVCLPPVRNLEPIKEAGILEGRNGIKETCLQHAARYLANQEWVKNDSLKIVENTAIPIIMLVVEVPHDLVVSAASTVNVLKESVVDVSSEQQNSFDTDTLSSETSAASPSSINTNNDEGDDVKSVRIDISFKAPSHTGMQTTELVKELTEQFPAATPLSLVLKQFLSDRSLDQSYSGGLSSYCLILLITRFLQHEHHLGRPINQNFGGLLMDFLYFFGNVYDPRQMRMSVQGSGMYIKRERGYSIDPIYIDDPLFPANNVGRNCFRIHQCIKAFADAYSILESQLTFITENGESSGPFSCKLLPKLIPSVGIL